MHTPGSRVAIITHCHAIKVDDTGAERLLPVLLVEADSAQSVLSTGGPY